MPPTQSPWTRRGAQRPVTPRLSILFIVRVTTRAWKRGVFWCAVPDVSGGNVRPPVVGGGEHSRLLSVGQSGRRARLLREKQAWCQTRRSRVANRSLHALHGASRGTGAHSRPHLGGVLMPRCTAASCSATVAPRCAASGAAIADAVAVAASSASELSEPRVDLVHLRELDEWCVTVNGARVLTFGGPSAWSHALSHQAALHDLLVQSPNEDGPQHPDTPERHGR